MDNDQPRFFDERTAESYDELNSGDTTTTVDFLEHHAKGGPGLELAIGTGRLALPLAARGIRVDGIDISPAMVAQLRAKPGGDQIAVSIGDFADVAVDGKYRLVYVVFNSLFNLGTQDAQVRCFENVAAHLTDDEQHVVLSEQGVRLFPVVTRYIWPSELDLMARIAGLRLKRRWAGWNRELFTPNSTGHVSVYTR